MDKSPNYEEEFDDKTEIKPLSMAYFIDYALNNDPQFDEPLTEFEAIRLAKSALSDNDQSDRHSGLESGWDL